MPNDQSDNHAHSPMIQSLKKDAGARSVRKRSIPMNFDEVQPEKSPVGRPESELDSSLETEKSPDGRLGAELDSKVDSDLKTEKSPVGRLGAELDSKVDSDLKTEKSPDGRLGAELDSQVDSDPKIEKSPVGRLSKNKDQLLYLDISQLEPWKYANRPEEEFGTEAEWQDFVRSIKHDGILQPVIARKKGKKYELIVGRRRYTAAKECGVTVIPTVVKSVTDIEAAAIQESENDKRKDVSTWAKAKAWQRYIDEGIFASKVELGAAFDVDKKAVNKVMVFNNIPKEIDAAITNKFAISNHFGQALSNYTKVTEEQSDDIVKSNINAILLVAAKINNEEMKISGFNAYMGSLNGKKKKTIDKSNQHSYDSRIGIVDGVKMFSLRKDSNGTPTIALLKDVRSIFTEHEIAKLISDAIEEKITKP